MRRLIAALFAAGCLAVIAADAGALPAVATWGPALGSPTITAHALTAFLHVVLVVFWLGPDVAVYVCSRSAVNVQVSAATRMAAARMMLVIDLMPRVCASLMLTVGGVLSAMVGVEHPPLQMAAILLLGPVWLAAVLIVYFRGGTALGATVDRLDTWFRMFLIVAIIASVTYATTTGRLAPAPYVGPKLLLFAAVILFGLLIRSRLRPLFEAVRRTPSGVEPSSADAGLIAEGIGRARPFFFAVWASLLLAALLGVVRLGAPATDEAAGGSAGPPTIAGEN